MTLGFLGFFALGLFAGGALGLLLGWALWRQTQNVQTSIEHAEQKLAKTQQQERLINKEQIEATLAPLRENIRHLSDDVKASSSTSQNLKGQLEQMHLDYRKLSDQADHLTRALKGEPQVRGQWGEVILSRILESSGLRKDKEYDLQKSYTNEETGEHFRPDAVINLPGSRAVIVDSKVSLLDYERYSQNKDKNILNAFLEAFRKQVKSLSDKDYPRHCRALGVENLDYILMFVPIESAFLLAMEKDEKLFDYAMRMKVIAVSPMTISLALQTIHHVWQADRQNKNVEKIALEGGKLYDKIASFLEDMKKHGKQLTTARETYDGAMKKLSQGRGNILEKARKLEKLGVNKSKILSEH